MPVHQIKHEANLIHPELMERIADELAGRGRGEVTARPIILEETGPSGFKHVTVIWPQWEGIPPKDRGKVILDAYEKARSRDEIFTISLAVGLTRSEAERLGIDWQSFAK